MYSYVSAKDREPHSSLSINCQSSVDFSCIITNSNVFQARGKSRTMCIYEKRPVLVWLKFITLKEPSNSTILQPKCWLRPSLISICSVVQGISSMEVDIFTDYLHCNFQRQRNVLILDEVTARKRSSQSRN